mmetsp:Transcript_18585/g.40225  ORF Transcript_18585/g.40225 Transcript_18585/m.40225 type:complete len:1247 (-) Transcript_18585:1784-5524(-)
MNNPTNLPPVVKGDADYRTYRPLLLDNGITILLAHDPQAKHFAASVSVHAGASSDPRALPGLAHFCEHMCFLGSKTYPEENEYKQYLAQHGGKSNASTSMSHTTYQFDVLADHGEKALDIFSHFFISPLFSKSGTQREVQAVDSENSKNLVSDGRRRWQVLKSLADDEHHFSKFSTGNKFTLPASASEDSSDSNGNDESETGTQTTDKHPLEDILKEVNNGKYDENDMGEFVRAALLAFHERQYRPKNMTAVMIGPQSLDELEAWVVPRFGQIPDRWLNKDDDGEGKGDEDGDDATSENAEKWRAMQRAAAQLVGESASDAPPVSILAAESVEHCSAFRPELLGGKWPVVLTTKPLQAVRNMVLFFPLPPSWHTPDRSPTSILSHLFGHEGPGSAFAILQDKGWISSLSAGNRISGPDQTLFQIQVSLTAEGEEQWKEVAKVIFHYGKMVCHVAEESFESSEGDAVCKDGDNELRRIWDEVAALDRMRFHQTSPGAVYSFASSVAQSISKHGTETCLSAGSSLNENGDTLPLKELLQFVGQIIPQNCFIERCSDGAWKEMDALYEGKESGLENNGSSNNFIFGKQTEKWYGVDYYISPVEKEDVQQWETDADEATLRLPEPNRYIPRTMELCEDLPEDAKVQRIEKPIDPPKLIVNKPDGRLWWRLDDRYALPKASVTILLRTATAENKLRPTGADQSETDLRWDYNSGTSMQSNFLTNIFADSLAQDTYDAYLAGLGWSLSKSSSGFTLSCSGYSDRLSDLAIKLLTDFCHTGGSGDETFLKQSHFETTKDKVVRGLKSYFESRRADSLALYYRNLLLSSKGEGIESNLELAEAMTLADVAKQHDCIWTDEDMTIEVLYTGNVSQKEAEAFFGKATGIIERTQSRVLQKRAGPTNKCSPWVPGPFERRLLPGEDLELHFASKNPKEENGAVIVTYQSQQPGFKGKSLSSEESLKQSAAIRLLCKMIKEPVFNELRTKQQLGYIVSSFYDVNYSTRQSEFFESSSIPTATGLGQPAPLASSIDSLVVYVLSKKEKPMEVANRIDDFLLNFKSRLEEMSTSEIQDYADSMAKALTKPIRKLGTEASSHMAKIRMYAPETLIEGSGYTVQDLPWDNPEVLAGAIRKLDRDAILKAYDSLVVKKESRSRIVSFVYGKTFPLEIKAKKPMPRGSGDKSSASSMEELMTKRKSLIAYDPSRSYPKDSSTLWKMFGKHKTTMRYAVAAAAVVGVGVWGTVAIKSRGDEKKHK